MKNFTNRTKVALIILCYLGLTLFMNSCKDDGTPPNCGCESETLEAIQAQNYYYNGSKKIKIYNSKNSFISYDKVGQTLAEGFNSVKTSSAKGFTILEDKKPTFSIKKFIKKQNNQISPALLLNPNGKFKIFPTKTIRVKLKVGKNKNDVLKLFTSNEILKTEDKHGILRVKIKDIHEVLKIANTIYEAGIAEFSIPDFYIPIKLNQINEAGNTGFPVSNFYTSYLKKINAENF